MNLVQLTENKWFVEHLIPGRRAWRIFCQVNAGAPSHRAHRQMARLSGMGLYVILPIALSRDRLRIVRYGSHDYLSPTSVA